MLLLKSILKIFVKIVIIIALLYGVGRFVVVFTESRLSGDRAPYLQSLSQDSVIIRWMTAENELGVVRFGEDSERLSTVDLEQSPTKNHTVKLTNLKPATRYYYQIGTVSSSEVEDAQKQWFITHPETIKPTRIWIQGDTGQVGDMLHQVRDSAINWMRENPLSTVQGSADSNDAIASIPLINVWMILGDLAYTSGSNKQFQAALFDPFEDLLANTSLWPVYGNHDDRRWTYFRIFDLPEQGEAGGLASNTENYYSFDYSNIHFVVLDSQASDRSADGKMAQWLKRNLAQNNKPWVIAAFHHPTYSKGSHDSDNDYDSRGRMQDMRENFLPILEAAGVDVVLAGHSHMYERSYLLDCAYEYSDKFSAENIVSSGIHGKHQHFLKPLQEKGNQGAVYVVTGSASKLDHGPIDHPAHVVGFLEAGSVVIDVVDNKLTARFINDTGQVRDEFTITKDAEYKSDYQGCNQVGGLQ